MKVTIIPIVIGAFGTVTERLLKGLKNLEVGGRVETIQTKALCEKISRNNNNNDDNNNERKKAKREINTQALLDN